MKLCKSIGNYVVLKYLAIAICIVGLHAASAQRAEAIPVLFESNYYEFVEASNPYSVNPYTGNNSWWDASAAAAASVFNGINGHLATLTSQAENDFLLGLVTGNYSGFAGAWLGGKDPEGWLVGPESGQGFSYTNWAGVEPNNAGYAYMSIGTTFSPGGWCDDSLAQNWVNVSWGQGVPDVDHDPVIGYFVEYEGAAPIPEPATMLLLGSGLIGLAGFRRKFRK